MGTGSHLIETYFSWNTNKTQRWKDNNKCIVTCSVMCYNVCANQIKISFNFIWNGANAAATEQTCMVQFTAVGKVIQHIWPPP